MPGPLPKDPSIRQRTNKAATRATLKVVADGQKRQVPPLPKGLNWHRMTRRWWKSVWTSPMAGEYLEADAESLFRLAVIVNEFWIEPKVGTFEAINRAQAMFGLTPLDRRRLEWTVEQAESAKDRGKKRQMPEPLQAASTASDPRKRLTMV